MAAGSGAVDAGAAVEQRPGCAYGLFGLFALFGLVFAGFGLAPMLELWRARSWPPTPCTSSESSPVKSKCRAARNRWRCGPASFA